MDMLDTIAILRQNWSADTAFDAADWSPENPARGQCAISSLVMQDLFGGEIVRFATEYRGHKEKHYANMINGALIDVTRSQYGDGAIFIESAPDLGEFKSVRERLLADPDTARRYGLLKQRFSSALS